MITAACLLLSAPCAAQTPPPASPPAKIADVAWLQGYWVGEGMGGTVEDIWFPPKAGVLLGAFRLMKADGSPGFYEIFAIELAFGGIAFTRQGEDAMRFDLTMRGKEGASRTETMIFKRRPL